MKVLKHISAFLACFMLCTAGHAIQIRREPGHRIPEYILPTDPDNPALWTPTSSSILTRAAAAPGAYARNDISRFGVNHYPLVLVEFKNRSFSIHGKQALLDRYERIFNEHGYTDNTKYNHKGYQFQGATGSVSDYFTDQSYGQYTPIFDIIGPIRLSQDYSYYGEGAQGKDIHIDQLILEVLDSIISNNLANISGYAINGTIHQFSIIYAGQGENFQESDANTIWPQASEKYFDKKSHPTIYNSGINHVKYACTCELFWDSDTILDGIGTFCHEFSHTLGLPDFYDTTPNADNETNVAMGFWSLMDYGNYENGGFSPVGYTAFEKYSLGWMNIEEITSSGSYHLNDISQQPDPGKGIHTAYRLSTGNDNQFIILENHIKTGWYKYHASEGLMVTAVDYNKDSWGKDNNVNTNPKRYHILPADNNYKRNTNAGDLFPYQFTDSDGDHLIDSITTKGKPELSINSVYPPMSIYNIAKDGNNVTFRVVKDIPSGIENRRNQQVSISVQDGTVSVTAPIGSAVTIHNISGKAVSEIQTTNPTQQISLPGRGIWIIKCGKTTRKVQL